MIASHDNEGLTNCGKANQGASITGLKSTKPNRLAVRYPTMIPQKIGINFNIPRPNIEARMAVSRATSASGQFSFAIFTPEPANDRPIKIITGPITTGGKSRLIKPIPLQRTNRLINP